LSYDKSNNGNWVIGCAVSCWSCLSPNPGSTYKLMVEISPKIVLSAQSLSPIPRFLDLQISTVHVFHEPSISELGKLWIFTKWCFAKFVTCNITIDFQASNGISHCNDSTSPSLVERLIGVIIRCEIWVEVIVRSIEFFGVHNAKNWYFHGAWGISK